MPRSCSSAFLNSTAPIYPKAVITLSDNTVLTLENPNIFHIDGNDFSFSAMKSQFPIGEVVGKTLNLSIVREYNNVDYSQYDFYMARIVISGYKRDVANEYITVGTFTVVEPATYGAVIRISATDDTYKLDAPWTRDGSYSLASAYVYACEDSGITWQNNRFRNYSLPLPEVTGTVTNRQILQYCALMAGGNAFLQQDNKLRISSYTPISYTYNLGDTLLADPIVTGAVGNVEVAQFTVTGIKVKYGSNEYLYGTDDYALTVSHPLITTEEQAAECAETIYKANCDENGVCLLTFSPASLKTKANIRNIFMDSIRFSTRRGKTVYAFITDIKFVFGGATEMACKAEVPKFQIPNASTLNNTSAIQELQQQLQNEANIREIEIQNITDRLLSDSYVYSTEYDGKQFFHNRPNLEESTTAWVFQSDLIAVFSNFNFKTYQTDTPTFALDISGAAILDKIYANRINASYIGGVLGNIGEAENYWNLDTGELHIGTVDTFFEFGADSLIIGKKDSEVRLKLQNDILSFVDVNDNVLASMDTNRLFIKSALVEKLQLGTATTLKWEFVQDSHGLTIRRL